MHTWVQSILALTHDDFEPFVGQDNAIAFLQLYTAGEMWS